MCLTGMAPQGQAPYLIHMDRRNNMTVESTGFKASDVLAGNLQKVLTDVTALSLVGKQLHWNITGEGFR